MARKPATPETKAAKFIRLANKRAVKAIKAIRGLGQLTGRAYEWKQDQVDKLFTAVAAELKASNARFSKDTIIADEIKIL